MSKMIPYEMSLWRNEDRYIIKVGDTYTTVSSLSGLSDYTIINEYTKEIKIGIIGSTDYKSPIHCNNITLTQNVNGTNQLTFDMLQHYYDDETFERKENPYINYLVANSHIKLKYDYVYNDDGSILYDDNNEPIYQWYDFLIQSISESQEKNCFSYVCNDLYINELSKNGYNVELATELENSMGSALTLSESILANTNWKVVDYDGTYLQDGRFINSDFLKASNNEILYVWTLSESITASIVDDYTYQNHSWTRTDPADPSTYVTIPANSEIYISSTSYINKLTPITFLWIDPSKTFIDKNGNTVHVILDDNGTILSSPNYQVASLPGYESSSCFVSDTYRGNILLSNIVTKYLADINSFCGQYTRTEYYHELSDTVSTPIRGVAYFTRAQVGSTWVYTVWNEDQFVSGVTYYILNQDSTDAVDSTTVKYYSYTEYEYASLSSIIQLISNNTNFSDNNSWDQTKTEVLHYTPLQGGFEETVLRIKFSDDDSTLGECYNTGIESNKAQFEKGLVKNEKYWCAVRVADDAATSLAKISGANVSGAYTEAATTSWTQFFVYDPPTTSDPYPTISELPNYKLFRLKCNQSVSYDELLKYTLRFNLYGYGTRLIVDCQFFKEAWSLNSDGTKTLIVPNLSKAISEVVRTKHYMFRQDYAQYMKDIVSINDIYFSDSCYADSGDLEGKGYIGLVDDTYEKVTTVTGAESNYFNLIQDVCERFECWAKFIIEHDDTGRIIYHYSLTEDTEPLAGKHYYKLRSPAPSEYTVEDDLYQVINENAFYTQVASGATYNPSLIYYSRLADGIYSQANLGYQFTGFQTNYYYRTYSNGKAQFTQCTSSSTYDNTIDYYMLVRGSYRGVTVTDDFHNSPTSYYLLNNNTSIPLASDKEYFDPTLTYEKIYNKYLVLKQYVGRENQAGFRYGINLNYITRNVKSDAICTKLYVKDINEELADNGICSIQDAIGNMSGETSIYNFQYYVNNGLLTQQAMTRDLYGDENGGGIAFITKLATWNESNRPNIEKLTQLTITVAKIESQKTTYEQLINAAVEEYDKAVEQIISSTGWTKTKAQTEKLDQSATSSQNEYTQEQIILRDKATETQTKYNPIVLNLENQLSKYKKIKASISKKVTNNATRKMELITTFFKKYSQFVHEGTWNGSGYYDANMYYSDAVKIAYTSAFPKVEYSLNAIEISQLDGYENYNFQVGDKTFIEDVEFFGKVWNTGRPYQEEVIVSQIKYCLDSPASNTITIQNYKTQFEDLFQRVAATTSSYETNKNAYNSAAELATDSAVSEYLINKILKENTAVISNAGAQTVALDERGLTITDSSNPNLIMRAVGGGIVLTTDGGNTWHTGLTAQGINADALKVGTIDTSRISIWNGGYTTFQWNGNGLMAYYHEDDQSGQAIMRYTNKFVRFDENGIYGSKGWGATKEIQNKLNSHPSLADIQQYAVFSLTWNGFTLQTPEAGNWVKISNTEATGAIDKLYKFVPYEGEVLVPGDIYYVKTTDGKHYMRVSDTQKVSGREYYTREEYGEAEYANLHAIISAGTGNLSEQKTTNFQLLNDGSIICNNGVFNGIVCATDIVDASGNSMLVDGQWATDYMGYTIAVFG